MRRLLYVAVAAIGLLLLLLAYVVLRPPGSAAAGPLLAYLPFTPENQARRSACGFTLDGSTPATNFHVHSTYRVGDEAVVVYSVTCPPGDAPDLVGPVFGALRAQRMEGPVGLLAYGEGGGSIVGRQPSLDEPLLVGADAGRGWALVYGRALTPPITTVEVDFDDGSTLRAGAAGVFSALSRSSDSACEVRGLDEAGGVVVRVQGDELGAFPFLVPGEAPPVDDCPR